MLGGGLIVYVRPHLCFVRHIHLRDAMLQLP